MTTPAVDRSLTLGRHVVSDSTDCYVIAEIGHNHQGDLRKAEDLFHQAKMAGVQAVKLQKRDNRSLFTKAFFDKPYENENSFGKTYGEHREFLEFGKAEYKHLAHIAKDLQLDFFATAFDIPSADFLAELDLPIYKLASGDLRNAPLLKHVAKIGKPMILSTGGAGLDEVRRAADLVGSINPNFCLLQCTATYPTEAEDMNLQVIQTLRREFPGTVIGLSDHYNGIAMAVAAYVLGARVFEKHFTLNHTWKGTDHALSLEPIGMHKMVRDLQRARLAMGDGVKRVLPQEESAVLKMGKSLFAARELPAGHVLQAEDVAVRSPGNGIPPYQLESVLGKTLPEPLREDDLLPATLLK